MRTNGVWLVLSLTACVVTPSQPEQPRETVEIPADASGRCVRYASQALDPSLSGAPREPTPRCCESSYGFDPKLAARSCGFASYLGESEELACVHRFRDQAGYVHELRVTPMLGLELAAAIALHERGEFGEAHTADWLPEREDVWLSSEPDRQWALISGWSATRRLSWDASACSIDQMQPVLIAMADAQTDVAELSPLPRMDMGLGMSMASNSWLRETLVHPREHAPPYALPRQAVALVDAGLSAAVLGEPEALLALMHDDARWGLPDRRELGARPVRADDSAELIQALWRVLGRMPASARVHCPVIDRRVSPMVARGEVAMWCVMTSHDQLDVLAIALRGEVRDGQLDGRISYVGLFPVAPQQPLRIPGEPPPPPISPRPQLRCGDPHAPADVCPRTALEDDDDDDDDDDDGETAEDTEGYDEDEFDDAQPGDGDGDDSATIDERSPATIEEFFDQLDMPGVRDLDRQ